MLTGAESVEEAIQLCTEVVKVLESGGFHLQKSTSNNKQVLQHFVPSSSQTTFTFVFKPEDKVPELKRCVNVFKLEEIQLFPYDRFSRFSKLVRVVAWCRRFITRCRKEKIESSFLTADELCTSKITLVKMCQRESFIEEIQELEKTGMCKKGKLLKLNPFLDSENVLRVGGRIQLSECKYEKKHPALLCSKHPFTKLLFAEQHVSLFHAGHSFCLLPFVKLSGHLVLKQHFWHRWSLEYITELQVRTKWQRHQDALRAGDLVILKDNNAPPF
nr:unnamed protein product [Callosobruchus analis]